VLDAPYGPGLLKVVASSLGESGPELEGPYPPR
jgi:hypothetical protein